MTLRRIKEGNGYLLYWDGPGCACGSFPGVGVLWQWWSGERFEQLYQCLVCSRDEKKLPLSLHPPNRLTVLKGHPKGARVVMPRRPELQYSRGGVSVWEAAVDDRRVGDGGGVVLVEDKTVNGVKQIGDRNDGSV